MIQLHSKPKLKIYRISVLLCDRTSSPKAIAPQPSHSTYSQDSLDNSLTCLMRSKSLSCEIIVK
ncbi:hypothetical protein [Nostoc sp. NOS(2021)]|uniref:hypothetical protein n=1 Tax=Nostoc sp. NOS(2021) TaxID=2815407 RepID=UPI0025DC32B2|nr:hypothetical protein [Nostoc sp. NOS(2021)]